MHAELTLSTGTLFAFLLVLARVAGAMSFVPLPGISAAPGAARIVLAVVFTLALAGSWPAVDATSITVCRLAGWAMAEAAIGVAIGVSVAVVLESFTFAAQVLGVPAGYGYASTVDPNTQADSGILLVFAELMAGLFFFALGLDREVLRLFARSLEHIPAGAYIFGPKSAAAMVALAAGLFSTGVRIALPVVALMIMVDVALALLGRLNSQLQLLSLAFPLKMLAALAMLAWLAALFPRILLGYAEEAFGVAQRVLGI